MGQKRHTPEQIIQKLRGAEVEIAQGATVAEAAKKIEVTEQALDSAILREAASGNF